MCFAVKKVNLDYHRPKTSVFAEHKDLNKRKNVLTKLTFIQIRLLLFIQDYNFAVSLSCT